MTSMLDDLRAIDPEAYVAICTTAGELLESRRSEVRGRGSLPVSCALPECDEVVDGGDAWKAHVADHLA